MQFLLLLSAIMAALSGAASGRVSAPQQLAGVRSADVEALVAEPAAIATVIVGVAFALVLRLLWLPRPRIVVRTIALYQERRRV